MNDLHDLISVPEAAKRAGVSRDTIRRAARDGKIKAAKPGRNWLIFAGDLERWKSHEYRPDMAYRFPPGEDESSDADEDGTT